MSRVLLKAYVQKGQVVHMNDFGSGEWTRVLARVPMETNFVVVRDVRHPSDYLCVDLRRLETSIRTDSTDPKMDILLGPRETYTAHETLDAAVMAAVMYDSQSLIVTNDRIHAIRLRERYRGADNAYEVRGGWIGATGATGVTTPDNGGAECPTTSTNSRRK